jgi:hypothetical protein
MKMALNTVKKTNVASRPTHNPKTPSLWNLLIQSLQKKKKKSKKKKKILKKRLRMMKKNSKKL